MNTVQNIKTKEDFGIFFDMFRIFWIKALTLLLANIFAPFYSWGLAAERVGLLLNTDMKGCVQSKNKRS